MTFDLRRYEEESRRLAAENPDRDGWIELAESEGIEEPIRFLESFGLVTTGILKQLATARALVWEAGTPMMAALMVGLRIGRMEAMSALEDAGDDADEEGGPDA